MSFYKNRTFYFFNVFMNEWAKEPEKPALLFIFRDRGKKGMTSPHPPTQTLNVLPSLKVKLTIPYLP